MRRTGARVVHAHNVNPTFGWRALAAAREAGRARRAAPPQLPARVRGRDLLHPRGGLHALPRPQHAARRAAQLPRRLAGGVGRLRRLAGALAGPDRGRRPIASSSRARSRCGGCGSWARRSTTARACCGRSSASSRAPRAPRRAPRPLRGPPEPREGRRRRREAAATPGCRSSSRATGRGGRAPRAGRRRRALHRPGLRRRRLPSCAATPPSPWCRRATRRSCRWPRWRRWRPGCPSSPRARAGWPRSCRRRACIRPATSPRWRRASRRLGATPRGRARARRRARALRAGGGRAGAREVYA